VNHLADTIFLTYIESDLKSLTPSCLVLFGVGRSMLCSHDRLPLHSRRSKNPFLTPASLACDCSSACTGRTAVQTVPTQVHRRDAFSFLLTYRALRSALFSDVRQLRWVVSRRRFGTNVGAVFLDPFCDYCAHLNNGTGMCLRNVGQYRLTPRRKPETTHIYRAFLCFIIQSGRGHAGYSCVSPPNEFHIFCFWVSAV